MPEALLLLSLWCAAAPEPPSAPPAPAFGLDRFVVGASAGYAFRPHPDARSHGAAAQLYADAPVFGPLGARLSAFVDAWGESAAAPGALLLGGGALSLLYAFDDTDTVAQLGLGPLLGASVDGALPDSPPALRAGALLSLSLRFPLLRAASVQAGIEVPFVLVGPEGLDLEDVPGAPPRPFPFQVALTVGLSFAPAAIVESALAGEDPLRLVL